MDYKMGEIIVILKDGVSKEQFEEALKPLGLLIVKSSSRGFWYVVQVPTGEEEKYVSLFNGAEYAELIRFVELNWIMRIL